MTLRAGLLETVWLAAAVLATATAAAQTREAFSATAVVKTAAPVPK